EWPGPDGHRRVAAGLRGDNARCPSERFRADDDEGRAATGFRERHAESPELLGVRLRPPEAWNLDATGEGGDQRDLSPDHQRRRGAAPKGDERPDDEEIPRQ